MFIEANDFNVLFLFNEKCSYLWISYFSFEIWFNKRTQSDLQYLETNAYHFLKYNKYARFANKKEGFNFQSQLRVSVNVREKKFHPMYKLKSPNKVEMKLKLDLFVILFYFAIIQQISLLYFYNFVSYVIMHAKYARMWSNTNNKTFFFKCKHFFSFFLFEWFH